MLHKAWSSIEEVPYFFWRSSVKFEGHTAQKNRRFWAKLGISRLKNRRFESNLSKITRPVAAIKSLRFALFISEGPPATGYHYLSMMFIPWHNTVYPKKYAHGFVVLCFVVVIQSFIMNSHEVFIHIHQGCFAGTGAIVRLPQCQWSKPDGYGEISQCITTTKHSKAKTVCIFLGIYCILLSM